MFVLYAYSVDSVDYSVDLIWEYVINHGIHITQSEILVLMGFNQA